jgi:CheY-like chemotaxis protein/two-component sensor histidine kinase
LAPIGTATELLARTLPVDSGAQLALDIIKRQSAQLARLVDDLLDVGRIAQGRIQLQQMPLELASVITQAVETVQPKLRQKQHNISILTSEDPLYVRGDFARLVQCVENVLTNAVKYTERHGKIHIETQAEGEMAVISVSDNGVGIPGDLLSKVFDLFVQGNRTLDRAEGGLGIGLAVVKKLIHMHCGEVTAESSGLGKGTTFRIRLPRIAQPAAIKSPAITSFNVSPRRILIVDDNADFAQSLATLLSTAGHQIVVVFGGRQALEAIESFQPEVALVDIGLPEMNGYDLALRLRADAKLNGLKLVAVTGYGLVEDRQRARTAGFDHHLLKPIDMAALERILASMSAEAADEVVNQPWADPNPYADRPQLSV